ncbi:MAG: hypothetical protein GYA32_03090 [Serratia sp.]|nr:hypothetical protein [Serratia sp. (in: enterobacteria)]
MPISTSLRGAPDEVRVNNLGSNCVVATTHIYTMGWRHRQGNTVGLKRFYSA